MSEETIENIENITKLDSNSAPNFVDHYLLTDMNFNEHKNVITIFLTH